jgi:hypothetical protein
MQHEPEVQKHGHINGHTERSTSKKVHPKGKGQVVDDSSGKVAGGSEGSSSSKTSSYSQKIQKKRKDWIRKPISVRQISALQMRRYF